MTFPHSPESWVSQAFWISEKGKCVSDEFLHLFDVACDGLHHPRKIFQVVVPRAHQGQTFPDHVVADSDRRLFSTLSDEGNDSPRSKSIDAEPVCRDRSGAIDRPVRPQSIGEIADLLKRITLARIQNRLGTQVQGQ